MKVATKTYINQNIRPREKLTKTEVGYNEITNKLVNWSSSLR